MSTEELTLLTNGWIVSELGPFIASMANGIYKPNEYYSIDGVACLRMYNIQDGGLSMRNVKRMVLTADEIEQFGLLPDDIVINRVNSRELVGKAAICSGLKEPTIFESKNIRLRLSDRFITPQYVNYFLMTGRARAHFDELAKQTVGMATVSQPQIRSLPLPLPPLAEQRRIVAAVERLLGRLNKARGRLAKVPEILKRFRQSVLAAACSGRLTASWRKSHPIPRACPDGGIRGTEELPISWQRTSFGNLIHSIRSGSTVPPQNEPTPFPILRSSSVRPGFVDFQDARYLKPEQSENEANYLAKDDLVFTRLSGSLEYVANCACISDLHGKRVQYPDRVFCAKLKHVEQGAYLVLAFTSPTVRKELTDGAKSSAGHQRVSLGNITEQVVPLPPNTEMREIVRRVEALFALADAIERRVAGATRRAERLTQAVLSKAFRGELVPTEAELARSEGRDYEPATVLLERIRTEKAVAASGVPANGRARGASIGQSPLKRARRPLP